MDLHPGNPVVKDGRIFAVLDFGLMGVGDPACDLMVAWGLLDAEALAVFRQEVGADEAIWRRDQGWAVYCAIIDLASCKDANLAVAAVIRQTLAKAITG